MTQGSETQGHHGNHLFQTFFIAASCQRIALSTQNSINAKLYQRIALSTHSSLGTSKMMRALASCGRLFSECASVVLVVLGLLVSCVEVTWSQEAVAEHDLQPLPAAEKPVSQEQVELGRLLFFDGRLSGDATVSCATCHRPELAWCDGLPLAAGYPGSLNFRNTPSLLNVSRQKYAYWDGRLPISDLPTIVRDHISEAHFMQADGRLVIERLKQVPEYRKRFQQAYGAEPSYGRILGSVSAFVRTVRSADTPFDKYLRGQQDALTESAKRGLALFRGAGRCVECHHGALLTDGQFHNIGVPDNSVIFDEPLRHITFRRFFRTLGVPEYEHLRRDPGLYGVTKRAEDMGRFRTPTLREIGRTAPYMHNGSFKTLNEVVAFYNRGGGDSAGQDPRLQPLGLSDQQQADLVEFLTTLDSQPQAVQAPDLPEYGLTDLGTNE